MPYREVARYAGRYAARYAAQRARAVGRRAAGIMRMRGKLGVIGRGGRRTRRGKSRFAKAVRGVILSTTERCYKSKAIDGYTMNHDSLTNWEIWSGTITNIFPQQGLGDGERIGDEIYVTGIMVRMVLQVPQDRRNTKMKFWYVPHNTDVGALTKANFFHNVSNNVMVDPIQTDRWKGVRYLGLHQMSAVDQTTGSQDKTIIRKFWIPLYKKVTFQSDGSQVVASGLAESGTIVGCAYDTISTLTTDTLVTNSEVSFTLYYKCP